MKLIPSVRWFAALLLGLSCLAPLTPAGAKDAQPPTSPAEAKADAAPAAGLKEKPKPLPPVTALSLTNIFSPNEDGNWAAGSTWTAIPRGRSNEYAGVRFRVEGVLKLQGRATAADGRKFREKIELPLPKATNVTTLHLLGGMYSTDPFGTRVAEVIWRYTDGSFKRTPLLYGVHMRNWRASRYEDPEVVRDRHSKAVWRAPHEEVAREGKYLRLYLTSLANPETNKLVKSLEFTSAMANPNLFLVGVTLDGLPAGARDGDFHDLDEGRGGLTGTQVVTVLDAQTGKPVAGARVKAQGKEHVGTPDFAQYEREALTAGNGTAAVQQSQNGLDLLEIRVEADNYVTAQKQINLKKGEKLPTNLEIRLSGGLVIGGTVENPEGQPVAGAQVSVDRYFTGMEDGHQGEDFEFNHRAATTDAEGKWTVKGVPLLVLSEISLSAKHPDFVPGNGTAANQDTLMTQLTNLAYIIRLARGSDVAGVVLGPDDRPFPGAKVKAGSRGSGDSLREATTGSDGRFHLANVRPELQAVTATMDGYVPVSKVVTPGTNTTELTLKLSRGVPLTAMVVDPEGQPVPEAHVSYQPARWDFEWMQRNNLEWDGTTDTAGRFEWKGAPAGESEFTVWKDGYALKAGVKLRPGVEDQVIRLSRARKVLGVVGDAQTGQPIAQFFVLPGTGDGSGFNAWNPSEKREFTDAEGHFTLELSEPSQNGLQVGAEDYQPKFVTLPEPKDDYVTVTVMLERNRVPEGTVVDAAGQPVAGAQVGLIGADWNSSLQVGRGRLLNNGPGSPIIRTDAEGHFKPPSIAGPQLLVAVTPEGYGEIAWAEFEQTRTIVLQPFGRIEGTVSRAGKPLAGQGIYLMLSDPRPGSLSSDWNAFHVDTDAEGKFVIEQVPAGERELVRLIPMPPNGWMHSHATSLTALPGQTTTVALGNVGAIVSGHLDLNAVIAGRTNMTVTGSLSTPPPRPPEGVKSPAEVQAWLALPETVAAQHQVKRFALVVQPDGSFSVDGVEPGSFTLSFNGREPREPGMPPGFRMLGGPSGPVQVGEEAANSVVSIDLGEVVLVPPSAPARR